MNVFSGPARDFFFEHTHPHMRYEELGKVLLDEYENDARQLAAQSELERLTFDQAMMDGDAKSLDAGLTFLVDKINVLTPQASPEFRSEEHKKRFLRKAVLHAKWASTPIAQMTTARFSFNRFVTALREQIQFEEERRTSMPSATGTYFGKYAVHPKSLQYRSRNNRPSHLAKRNPIGRDGRRMLCHTRGSDSHLVRQHNTSTGTKYSSLRTGVVRSLQNGTPAIHVLSEVVNSFQDENSEYEEEANGPEATQLTEAEEFQSLTAPHITDMNEETDTDDTAAIQSVDETQALGHMAARMPSGSPSITAVPKRTVHFPDHTSFGEGV